MTFAGYAVGFKIQNLLSHHDLYIFLDLITNPAQFHSSQYRFQR
jgi:hypothetical protein